MISKDQVMKVPQHMPFLNHVIASRSKIQAACNKAVVRLNNARSLFSCNEVYTIRAVTIN